MDLGDSESIIDKIGPWSEIKLEIIKEYATAYSIIMSKQPGLDYIYIDGFAGTGVHRSKTSGEYVLGSPQIALNIKPPFKEYFFIDINKLKIKSLDKISNGRKDIHILQGDCNKALLSEVFPKVKYEDYKRALCLLDPYGLHLNWEVIQRAGELRTIEIFFNLMIMDINLNVLLKNTDKVTAKQKFRMNKAWGDNSWEPLVYNNTGNLFGFAEKDCKSNELIANAFRERLKNVAGFSYVPDPIPMRNSLGRVIYYLYFASPNKTGAKVVKQIFDKYRNWGK
jgi:three-Cys-motif partner protein